MPSKVILRVTAGRLESSFVSREFSKHCCQHKNTCKTCKAAQSLKLIDIQHKLLIHKQVQNSGKCDTVLSMGLRSAANICQRVTNAISLIMLQVGLAILNYLNDLAGAERKEYAIFAYNCFGAILKKCGFEESKNKASPPSEIMPFGEFSLILWQWHWK